MEPILQTIGLTKNYGNAPALAGIDLSLAGGRICGLLGPNGSGKSTLIKLAAGLLTPTAGQVLIAGTAPGTATKAITGYLPDHMALPEGSRAADIIALYQDFFADFDAVKANAMLADLHLEPSQRIGAMSKGTQEKLQLCLVMSRAAKLYLLDEPLGGVDPAARDYIITTILQNYREDATLLLSTHLIGDIEKILDDIVVLSQGALLLQSSVDQLREERGMSVDAYFREVFKC